MTEQNNDQKCGDEGGDDNQQGCCSTSGDGKCFNWQKFIFVTVVIVACAVAAHSYMAKGPGTCPITGESGSGSAAICPSGESAGEQASCCPSAKPESVEAESK